MLVKNYFLNFFESIGEYLNLIIDVIKCTFIKFPSWSLLRDQLFSIGVLSIGVVAITGMSTGVVLAAQTIYQLSSKGLNSITGIVVAKAMITELGPILTAFMVTGRVGAAMCAELGTMKVSEQIDAMQSMAVNPNYYLIAPRLIGGIIMVPLLTIFSIIMGIFGGYLISTMYFDISPNAFLTPIPLHISFFDVLTALVKSFFFGTLMVSICCFRGMKTKGGAQGVGKSTTHSVVISYISILVADFLLTMALNSIHQKFRIEL